MGEMRKGSVPLGTRFFCKSSGPPEDRQREIYQLKEQLRSDADAVSAGAGHVRPGLCFRYPT